MNLHEEVATAYVLRTAPYGVQQCSVVDLPLEGVDACKLGSIP